MNDRKIILLGKLANAVKFDSKKWSGNGGDQDVALTFEAIARNNPDIDFIVISRNDIRKQPYGKLPSNLKDVYNTEKAPHSSTSDLYRRDYVWNSLSEYVKKDQIIDIILFSGMVSTSQLGIVRRKDGEFAKILNMFGMYIGPIVRFLNMSNLPWKMIMTDIRYDRSPSDCTNPPKVIYAQYDDVVDYDYVVDWLKPEEKTHVTTDIVYKGIEKQALLSKEFQYDKFMKLPDITKKNIDFVMILNETDGATAKLRYEYVTSYVANIENMELYGKWSNKNIINQEYYKGLLTFEDMKKKIASVKYTLMLPTSQPKHVTPKYIESLSQNVLPFFHPDYDVNDYSDAPKYLRVSSPEELKEKIEELNNNTQMYIDLLIEFKSKFEENDFNGVNMSKNILD